MRGTREVYGTMGLCGGQRWAPIAGRLLAAGFAMRWAADHINIFRLDIMFDTVRGARFEMTRKLLRKILSRKEHSQLDRIEIARFGELYG